MFRLSTQIAKLEDRWGKKIERRLEKYKGKWKFYLPLGLAVTLVGALLICLITKKGYIWFSGYKYIHDKRGFEALHKGHPALPPYGIFKLANRQIWGNIAIGLGNRLSVFQNPLVDKDMSHKRV